MDEGLFRHMLLELLLLMPFLYQVNLVSNFNGAQNSGISLFFEQIKVATLWLWHFHVSAPYLPRWGVPGTFPAQADHVPGKRAPCEREPNESKLFESNEIAWKDI